MVAYMLIVALVVLPPLCSDNRCDLVLCRVLFRLVRLTLSVSWLLMCRHRVEYYFAMKN